MTAEVVLVAGPPCAGKTTYVADHAQPGDLVLDQDVLGATRYQAALDQLVANPRPAWVIRCLPGPTAREAFAQRIGATRTQLLRPDTAELMRRAGARTNPGQHTAAVRSWLAREAADATPTDSRVTVQAWW